MKKALIVSAAVLVASFLFIEIKANSKSKAISSVDGEKVTICHREGNGSSHSITVSINAVPAHLAHGDAIGDCGPGGE